MRIEMDDGVGLAVEVTGDGAPLLLVHGFGGAKEDFADHVEALAAHATVVVFDHRGHGASDHPSGEAAYSLDRLAADTLGVADQLGFLVGSGCSATPWAGWSPASWCSPSRTGWTHSC